MTITPATGRHADLLRARRGRVDLVDVPAYLFASVEGSGAPGGDEFRSALGSLYTIAYGIHFAIADRAAREKVSPLEALWWTADPAGDFRRAVDAGGFTPADQAGWSWRALIRLPDGTSGEAFERVHQAGAERHPELAGGLATVEFGPWTEGLCVQTLHVGPYSEELPTVQLMHDFIDTHGYRPTGRHHEIYLGDPRRSAPDRLKTILRQPVERPTHDWALHRRVSR